MTDVAVTQADRECAASIMEDVTEMDGTPASFEAFRRGEEDLHPIVQRCARHRLDVTEDRDLWKQSEEVCSRQFDHLIARADALAMALDQVAKSLGSRAHMQGIARRAALAYRASKTNDG